MARVKVSVTIDADEDDDGFLDLEHSTGLSEKGFEFFNEQIGSLGELDSRVLP